MTAFRPPESALAAVEECRTTSRLYVIRKSSVKSRVVRVSSPFQIRRVAWYCRRHPRQMLRHGFLLSRPVTDPWAAIVPFFNWEALRVHLEDRSPDPFLRLANID